MLTFAGSKREIGKEEAPSIPSIPPTPEAFFIYSDGEEDNSCQMILDDNNKNGDTHNLDILTIPINRDPLEPDGVEDVFLCAECDIVFASKELCCRHMHDIHGLSQFNAEFIQQVIISKRVGPDGGEDSCSGVMDVEDTTTDSLTGDKDKREMRTKVIYFIYF